MARISREQASIVGWAGQARRGVRLEMVDRVVVLVAYGPVMGTMMTQVLVRVDGQLVMIRRHT